LDVRRSAVGNAIRETLPLMDQAGYAPAPATTRYRTGTDLLAAAGTLQWPDPNTPTS
jgi:hypothetical protein